VKPRTYSEAGVDIERGDRFAAFISRIRSSAVSGAIGSFSGGVRFPVERYRAPILLGTTDGVGTKLLVASRLGDHSTIGIDLVAMCVNDLAVCGADPLFFLDYIACGRVNETVLESVVQGIVTGCEQAGCTLVGGETAEMPDMYAPDEIDLAGFATGAVEEDRQLPKTDSMAAGDLVLGLASSGVHSNGFSLARTALVDAGDDVWKELLTPTRIYVRELAAIRHLVKAAAHITGGGIEGNLARVIPRDHALRLSWDWSVPAIFRDIAVAGSIEQAEMRAVFNMGIGIALVAAPENAQAIDEALGQPAVRMGTLVHG